MSEACPGCASLSIRLDVIESRLRALGQGLGAAVEPRQVVTQSPRVVAPPGPDSLRLLRPKAWESGRRAAKDGIPASACPYRSTRGGFRNAWLGGHASNGRAEPVALSIAPSAPSAPVAPPAPRITAAFQRGESAARAGDPVSACPFGLGESRNRDEWQRGWRSGCEARAKRAQV